MSATAADQRRRRLARMLEPASIAIVGLSETPGSFGQRTLQNLARFPGSVHGVHPRNVRVGRAPCVPSLEQLPVVPDCVILAVPRSAVVPQLELCARAGVGGVVVFASGFAETGQAEGQAQQARIARIAAESGMPVVGPNSLGFVNERLQLDATFAPALKQLPRQAGPLGIVSSSGALGLGLLQSTARGAGISHLLTVGNGAVLGPVDLARYLLDAPECRAVLLLLEGLRDGRGLVELGEHAYRAGKPVVVHRVAAGAGSAQAALSHTGALSGSDDAFRAAVERGGLVAVDRQDDALEIAQWLAAAGPCSASGVAVLGGSGGACISAASMAERHGVPLPQPSAATKERLRAVLPDFAAVSNPCDVTAQLLNDPGSFGSACDALLADPAYGCLVVPIAVAGLAAQRLQVLSELRRRHGKPLAIVWLSEWLEGPGAREIEASGDVAMFRSMSRCFAALAAWQRWQGWSPREAAARTSAVPAAPVLDGLLQHYGIPVPQQRLAADADTAVRAWRELGLVAMKVVSEDVPHKTEAGGVRLGLASEDAVRNAFDAILQDVRRFAPAARIDGMLLQQMVPSGVEVIVGTRHDPVFGPLVVVGAGGVAAELLQDTRTALAPVDHAQALDLIRSLRVSALLAGWRGAPPADLAALADIVVRVSEAAADAGPALAEFELNPVVCHPRGAIAVDTLLVRGPSA